MLAFILVSILIVQTGCARTNSVNSNVLVDLKDFKYLLDSSVCRDSDQKELLGVIIVTSYVGHVELRENHRQSISQSELNEMGLARVFLIAEIPLSEKKITQKNLNSEFEVNNDLVQGNFRDAYRNNTYKNMMGFKWSAEECPNAKFIIKIDDDTVYDVFFFKKFMDEKDSDTKFDRNSFLAGRCPSSMKPQRRNNDKWSLSYTDWPNNTDFPKYVSGFFYITTYEVVQKLVKLSESTPYFWIDDVFITGTLREKANVTITNIRKWFTSANKLMCINESERFTAWSNYSCDYHAGYDNSDKKLRALFTEARRLKSLQPENQAENILVDLKDFKYLMTSSVCNLFGNDELLGVIIVTSDVRHIELRASHRQSISQSELNQMGLARIFLVAEILQHEQKITNEDLSWEFEENNDLVQGNFLDTYRNATYKNVMGLKWVSEKCYNAKFIIKLDDDTVFDVFFYQKYLKEINSDVKFDRTNLLAGALSKNVDVHRKNSKWSVTMEEFPADTYPHFIQGGFYITTTQVARKFVILAESTPFFWVSDIYITGILREMANITITDFGKWTVLAKSLECSYENDVITAWSNYSCDYNVGFNNLDSNLLVLYTEAMRQKSLKS